MNNCDQQEGTGNERRALIYALHNFEALGLTGGILHVNSKIVAFTFGMPINHETFGVHVEKADTNIEGAYAMINYEFANRIPEYLYQPGRGFRNRRFTQSQTILSAGDNFGKIYGLPPRSSDEYC